MRYVKHGLSGKCGIYLITNTVNGKQYVGASNNIGARINQHFGKGCRKYASRHPFYADIEKYGRDAFRCEALEFCSFDAKIERESHWFDLVRPEYNLTEPVAEPFKHPLVKKLARDACNTQQGKENRFKAHRTPQHRAKCRSAQAHRMRACQGEKDGRLTPVFVCITDAAKTVCNGEQKIITVINHIKQCLDGQRKTAYGYEWKEVMPNEQANY